MRSPPSRPGRSASLRTKVWWQRRQGDGRIGLVCEDGLLNGPHALCPVNGERTNIRGPRESIGRLRIPPPGASTIPARFGSGLLPAPSREPSIDLLCMLDVERPAGPSDKRQALVERAPESRHGIFEDVDLTRDRERPVHPVSISTGVKVDVPTLGCRVSPASLDKHDHDDVDALVEDRPELVAIHSGVCGLFERRSVSIRARESAPRTPPGLHRDGPAPQAR